MAAATTAPTTSRPSPPRSAPPRHGREWRRREVGGLARRSETLGSDPLRIEPSFEQEAHSRLDEPVRTAHEGDASVRLRLLDQLAIDSPGVTAPRLGWLAGEREQALFVELVRVDHVVGGANRVDEGHRELRHGASAVAQDRHQGHNARPAADQQHLLLAAPHEVGGKGTADLELVAFQYDVVEVWGDLAVLQLVDRELDLTLVQGRGGNRVGAVGPVAVGGGEADVVVLARQVP